MPGKWIKVPHKRAPAPITNCETEGCENDSHDGHEYCTQCFRVKIHKLELCDGCGACHKDVIEDCKFCKSMTFGGSEPFKLCDTEFCKHKWNTLKYR